ncbi:peroxiredoxin-like family protein [Robertkochia sediminum]|uniref:peroxiredoxin-like family protein n=1 Tax=Robertkochia sediminum TaxID=2785326 RepID=UPI0019348692|nr:peroxiredoxin-like family protein [Robertkochia sediminum]MBL7471237.1 AhpC/TSA family protein [Robertkochia sediminum]
MKHQLTLMAIMCFVMCLSQSFAQSAALNPEDITPVEVGDVLPEAVLRNAKGEDVSLKKLIGTTPAVLVFYRGGWCPYCNLHLSSLAAAESAITDLGYQILAISPDDFGNLDPTIDKGGLGYTLLSDPGGSFITDLGIAFQTPEKVKGYVASTAQAGNMADVIPVPGVMVVTTEGEIRYTYFNPDYKVRMEADALLDVLKGLKK